MKIFLRRAMTVGERGPLLIAVLTKAIGFLMYSFTVYLRLAVDVPPFAYTKGILWSHFCQFESSTAVNRGHRTRDHRNT